jgi:hypothetical protein
MSSAKRFLPQGFCPKLSALPAHHTMALAKTMNSCGKREGWIRIALLAGRLAAATVMTTTFVPTRSGDGTFVLDFDLCQYTLSCDSFPGLYPQPFWTRIWQPREALPRRR